MRGRKEKWGRERRKTTIFKEEGREHGKGSEKWEAEWRGRIS
jgi:hypothetical protein